MDEISLDFAVISSTSSATSKVNPSNKRTMKKVIAIKSKHKRVADYQQHSELAMVGRVPLMTIPHKGTMAPDQNLIREINSICHKRGKTRKQMALESGIRLVYYLNTTCKIMPHSMTDRIGLAIIWRELKR